MNYKVLVSGALTGFLGAFLADLHAWSQAPTGAAFAWSSAFKRWVAGALSGALAGVGIGAVSA
jgi:hypothetical protein